MILGNFMKKCNVNWTVVMTLYCIWGFICVSARNFLSIYESVKLFWTIFIVENERYILYSVHVFHKFYLVIYQVVEQTGLCAYIFRYIYPAIIWIIHVFNDLFTFSSSVTNYQMHTVYSLLFLQLRNNTIVFSYFCILADHCQRLMG